MGWAMIEAWEIEIGNEARKIRAIEYRGTERGAIRRFMREWRARASGETIAELRRPGCRPLRMRCE